MIMVDITLQDPLTSTLPLEDLTASFVIKSYPGMLVSLMSTLDQAEALLTYLLKGHR